MRDAPLVVIVLQFLITVCCKIFDGVALVIGAPFCFLHYFVYKVNVLKYGSFQHRENGNAISHYFLIPVRYVLSLMFLPLGLLSLYAIFTYLYHLSLLLQESAFVRWLSISFSLIMSVVMYERAHFLLGGQMDRAKMFWDMILLQWEMLGFLLSILGHGFIVRIPAFFADLSRAKPRDVTNQCLKHLILSILIVIGLALSPILLINVSRIGHVYRSIRKYSPQQIIGTAAPAPPPPTGQRNVSFGEVLVVQEMKAFVETPILYFTLILCVLFPYRTKKYLIDLYNADVDKRVFVAIEFVREAVIDIPFIIMGLALVPMVWRWYSFVHYFNKLGSSKLRHIIVYQFAAALLDIPMVLSSILVCLSVYKVRPVQRKLEELWNVQSYSAIDPHKIIMAAALDIILDSICMLCSVVVLLFLYRVPNLYSNIVHRGDKPMRYVMLREVGEQLVDLPHILVAVLSLWRLPYLLYSVFQAPTARERRRICLRQFKQAYLDVPFVISVILLTSSLLHLLTLASYYQRYKASVNKFRKKKEEQANSVLEDGDHAVPETRLLSEEELRDKYRYSCMKNAALLPLQIPFIICTYVVVFTMYRLPITIRLIKMSAHLPNKKKLVLKAISVQTLCILLDVVACISSIIVMVTMWRAPSIVKILKEDTIFVQSLELSQAIQTHKKLFIVFYELIKDIPLILLVILSSFAVWRIGYIRKLLQEEKDYRKRMLALGLSTLLTILDVPCMLCTIVVLCSWRCKVILSLLALRWKEGTTIFIHAAVFREFYELIVDIPFIIMTPLSLWRVTYILQSLMKCSNASERRRLVFHNFVEMLIDVPYIFVTLFVVSSTYRIRYVVAYCRSPKKRESFRDFILVQAKQLAIDLPIVSVAFLSSVIMPFRLYNFFNVLYFATTDEERRLGMTRTTASTAIDAITVLYGVIIVATVYRVPLLLWTLKAEGFGNIRKILAKQVYSLLLDIQCLLNTLFIFYTIFHSVETTRRIVRYVRYLIKMKRNERQGVFTESRKIQQRDFNINVLPSEILASAFAYLEPRETCNSALVCKNWRDVSNENYLWRFYCENESIDTHLPNTERRGNRSLYHSVLMRETVNQRTFSGIVWSAFSGNPYKERYIVEYLARQPKKTLSPEENDYNNGFRVMMADEALDVWTHFYRFFMLPLILLATILVGPLYVYNSIRFYFRTYPRAQDTLAEIFSNDVLRSCSRQIEFFIVITATDVLSINIPRYTSKLVKWNFLGIKQWDQFMYSNEPYRVLFGLLNVSATWYLALFGFLNFSPLVYPIRQIVMSGLINLCTQLVTFWSGVSSIIVRSCSAVSPNLFGVSIPVLFPQVMLVQSYELSIRCLLKFSTNWLLFPTGYINLVLFYLLWWTITTQITLRSVVSAQAEVNKFFPLFGITHSYIGILGVCARSGYSMGLIGEVLLIPIAFAWVGMPCIALFWFRTYTAVVPALIASSCLVAAAKTELNTKWNQVKATQKAN